jgi:phenylacetate-CoA ligase
LELTRILLSVDSQFDIADIDKIKSGIKQRLGSGVEVVIELLDEVPKEKSGKFRYVVSHVASLSTQNGGRNTA